MIGVVGGMGPAAGFEFALRLTDACKVRSDQEHLQVVVWSDPTTPSRVDFALGHGPSPLPHLLRAVGRLVDVGATRFVVACNGAHRWLPDMEDRAGIPAVSLVDTTVRWLAERQVDRVGIVCTSATRMWKVYDRPLQAAGIVPVHVPPTVQPLVDATVADVKARRPVPAEFYAAVAALDVGIVVAACTELPALLPHAVDPAGLVVDLLASEGR